MRHEKLRLNIKAYLDGELDPRFTRRIEMHLVDCNSCKQELEELQLLSSQVRNVEEPMAAPLLRDQILERLRQEHLQVQMGKIDKAEATVLIRRSFQPFELIAATAVIALVALVIYPVFRNTISHRSVQPVMIGSPSAIGEAPSLSLPESARKGSLGSSALRKDALASPSTTEIADAEGLFEGSGVNQPTLRTKGAYSVPILRNDDARWIDKDEKNALASTPAPPSVGALAPEAGSLETAVPVKVLAEKDQYASGGGAAPSWVDTSNNSSDSKPSDQLNGKLRSQVIANNSPTQQSVPKQVDIILEVSNPSEAAASIRALDAQALKTMNTSVSYNNTRQSDTNVQNQNLVNVIVLRVPVSDLNKTLSQITKLGAVVNKNDIVQDRQVTQNYTTQAEQVQARDSQTVKSGNAPSQAPASQVTKNSNQRAAKNKAEVKKGQKIMFVTVRVTLRQARQK